MFVVVTALLKQLSHLQPLCWAVSAGTMSDIPNLWAVSSACQWKEEMSREILSPFIPHPKMWIAFFLPICFGLNSGLQSKNWKWLVRRGKEDSMSTAHPAASVAESPSCPLLCGCPCHTIPVGRHLHIHACLQIGVLNNLYSWHATKMMNPLPSSPHNTTHFLQSGHSSITWGQWAVVESTVTNGKIVLVNTSAFQRQLL